MDKKTRKTLIDNGLPKVHGKPNERRRGREKRRQILSPQPN